MCGSIWHTAFLCKYKPNATFKTTKYRMRPESPKSRRRRLKMAQEWFRGNPPDANGNWECYLQISTLCPKKLNRTTITLEHVHAKVRRPDLKYVSANLKPSCSFCNKMKGSRSVQELAKTFIHIALMINSKEWRSWEKKLTID